MKNLKKIIALLVVLALSLCMCVAFVSCGDGDGDGDNTANNGGANNGGANNGGANNGGANNGGGNGGSGNGGDNGGSTPAGTPYTVNLKDTNNAAVVGATVLFKLNNRDCGTAVSDASGNATLNIDTSAVTSGIVQVKVVITVPAGYNEYSSILRFDENATTLNVTDIVKDMRVNHTVKLVDVEGNEVKVAGISVLLCQSVCYVATETDTNGEAVFFIEAESGDFKVKIDDLADFGLEFIDPVETDGYVHITNEGQTTILVRVREI
ncbi:MAG: hypothetical protein J6Q69_03840 [Clostridia bacterium]|nr:hypothetical protein [Clostridia bacterium]